MPETDILKALGYGLARTGDPFLEMGQGIANLIGKLIPDKVDPTDEVSQFLERIKQSIHGLGPEEDPDALVEKIAAAIGRTPGEVAALLLPGGVLGKGAGLGARAALSGPALTAGILGVEGGLRAASNPEAGASDILSQSALGALTGGALHGASSLLAEAPLALRVAGGAGLGGLAAGGGAAVAGMNPQEILDEAATGAFLGGIMPPAAKSKLPIKQFGSPEELMAALRETPEIQKIAGRESQSKAFSAEQRAARQALEAEIRAVDGELKRLRRDISRNQERGNVGMASALMDRVPEVNARMAELRSQLEAIRAGDVHPTRDPSAVDEARKESIDFQARQRQQTGESVIPDSSWRKFKEQFIARESILEEAVGAVEQQYGIKLNIENNPVLQYQLMSYSKAPQFHHGQQAAKVIDRFVTDAGVEDSKYLSEYMMMRRLAGERQQMRNPGDITGPEAQQWLILEKQRNPQKAAAAEKALDQIHQLRTDNVLSDLLDAGAITKEQFQQFSANKDYSTFQLAELLGETLPGIKEQKGLTGKIADPILETLLNDAHLIGVAQRARAGRSLVDFMGRFMPDMIQEVPGGMEAPRGRGTVRFLQDGQSKTFMVPDAFARVYSYSPSEMSRGMQMYQTIASAIRKPFIDWNIAWALRNPMRDIKAMIKNVAEGNPFKATADTVKAIYEAVPETLRYVRTGEESPAIADMMKKRMMVQGGKRQLQAVDEMESTFDIIQRTLQKDEAKQHGALRNAFGKLTGLIEKVGEAGERITKVAAYKYGKAKGWNDAQIQDAVVNLSGSPNFYRRGTLFPIYNSILLFSNASKEGWYQSLRGFRRDPLNYMAKTLAFDLTPKVAMYFAAKGMFDGVMGDWMSKSLSGVSEHDKRNYTVVPLPFFTDSGKSIYFRLANDHTGQAIGSMIWNTLETLGNDNPQALQNILRTVVESMPYGPASLHPFIEQGVKTAQYASGINPTDIYRGRQIMPERVFEAGGDRAFQAYMEDMWNSLGGSSVKVFNTEDPEKIKSEIEKVLGIPLFGSALGSILKVSNYGQTEKVQQYLKEQRKDRTRGSLERDDIINQALREGNRSQSDMMRTYVQLKRKGINVGSVNQFKRRWKELDARMYGDVIKRALSGRGVPTEDRRGVESLGRTWGL